MAVLNQLVIEPKSIAYGVLKPGPHDPQGVPLVRIKDLGAGTINTKELHYITRELHREFKRTELKGGEVLISIQGTIGRVAVVPQALAGSNISRTLAVLRPREESLGKWLLYALQAPSTVRQIEGAVTGSTRDSLNLADLRQIRVPHADEPERSRIVAEIENQFSRLNEAVANLKRAKVKLKRYKAAVLKAAVEGHLVPNEAELARRESRRFEAGAQLLQRILNVRRDQWKGKGRYQEPAPVDEADLPELPEGWAYATAEQLTDQNRAITYGVIKLGGPVKGGVPVLRSSDVRSMRIDVSNVKSISPSIAENYRRTFLRGGEVVMTVRGTLGGTAVVSPQCSGFNISREVAMLALVEPAMAHVVATFIASGPVERWLLSRAKGIAYTGINIETLKALPLPVPPLKEQERIVAEVERHFSLAGQLQITMDAALKRALAMRDAILRGAFTGGLAAIGRTTLKSPS